MLRAHNLNYSISNNTLLSDASLTIRPGELTVILGPNGAGKSTFMNLLCGDLHPSSGGITLDDIPINRIEQKQIAKRRAMMPQSSRVVFPFAALEIVMIGRSPHVAGSESRQDLFIAQSAMACTGVSHLASRNYNTLSGGEQQRVQLARALAQIWDEESKPSEARYLLLDEPVASMDLSHQHETLRIAKMFAQRNVGVLVILHDINLASMYADRLAIFEGGKIRRQGTPRDVLNEELLTDVFDINVMLSEHPTLDCPLMVTIPSPIPQGSNELSNVGVN
ncbi:MAG: heme ABC transporter ATP-binding protein [Pseudohongiellaceae bacterium]